jgi:hypothetical protein
MMDDWMMTQLENDDGEDGMQPNTNEEERGNTNSGWFCGINRAT